MSTAAPQPPVIPPRPSRGQDKDQMPKIPPRPVNRKLDRSRSPNRDRFAASPLNDNHLFANKSPKSLRFGGGNGSSNLAFSSNGSEDPIDRSSSVDMPSVGEEGKEYAIMAEELSASRAASTSPEQTRRVGEDLKLHAPKPSLPATSAKQRVAAVTRTDSDRAASFGIGRPSSDEVLPSNRSLRKKPSTISQVSDRDSHIDDEQGIPQIGKQVPMYPNAGDVQAPSPAPGPGSATSDGQKGTRNHTRRTSARGFADLLPPGSYGLHGHGVKSTDKLERAYYEKHPDLVRKEHTPHHHDRANDFSMSRDELNKIVRETASRGSGNDVGGPSEQAGWQAIEESASRIASPRPTSAAGPMSPSKLGGFGSLGSQPDISISDAEGASVIHVDDNRRKSVMFEDDDTSISDKADERRYSAPILAEDELAKDPRSYMRQPAVTPPLERSGSAFEMEPSSRPSSRPASIYKDSSLDIRSTPLEDVEEYEPLFPEDEKKDEKKDAKPVPVPDSPETLKKKHRFPGQDVWEDAPASVHYTAEVNTPDERSDDPAEEDEEESKPPVRAVPKRENETPAHAFARRHEQLAEAEASHPDAFLHRSQKQKPNWVQAQPHLAAEKDLAKDAGKDGKRPSTQRFPSRDVWEDTPDSLLLETTVSHEQEEAGDAPSPVETTKSPEIPQRPVKASSESPSTAEKPVIPGRPRPKQASPIIPDRPKPQIPSRPAKFGAAEDAAETASAAAPVPKAKPAVPARGGKIAALQAGFMSDLNKRLQLGPQAPKKEETPAAASDEVVEEKEKAPLADARKGRARGPQRRAPAKTQSPSPAAAAAAAPEKQAPVFSFSSLVTVFCIDPEVDELKTTDDKPEQTKAVEPAIVEAAEDKADDAEEKKAEVKPEPKLEAAEKSEEQEEAEKEEVVKKDEPEEEAATVKTVTLASNMAGEPIAEVDVKESEDHTVEPLKGKEEAKDD